ncbi:hypothetical protein G4G27_16925 [Sphingomonas sp. So64.6b]|nr:hypothetical protein G4G27_16925 [Sphingomonas sp. So64.6b]
MPSHHPEQSTPDDQVHRLITATESQEVVKDRVATTHHPGWDKVHVAGTEAFRRSAASEAARCPGLQAQ